MKPVTPHDPLDDLIAAALHGDLTPEERTRFEARLNNDAASQAAYQEAKLMHDLLEKTHHNAQPDSNFEQRMVSGVRRKIKQDEHTETAWESLLVLWNGVKRFLPRQRAVQYGVALAFVSLIGFSALLSTGGQVKRVYSTISSQLTEPSGIVMGNASMASSDGKDLKKVIEDQGINYVETAQKGIALSGYVDTSYTEQFAGKGQYSPDTTLVSKAGEERASSGLPLNAGVTVASGATTVQAGQAQLALANGGTEGRLDASSGLADANATAPAPVPIHILMAPTTPSAPADQLAAAKQPAAFDAQWSRAKNKNEDSIDTASTTSAPAPLPPGYAPTSRDELMVAENQVQTKPVDAIEKAQAVAQTQSAPAQAAATEAPAVDTRKLIRNAQLDLEVKSYQTAMDQISALTKSAGGYVDTSNSQKGGNGKLQGTVVVKVLPQNLDAFLLKLRDLGELANQSVSTDDVTKDYFDTQARLDNSRRMESQLQELLKRDNGKVSDLLQVERELGRVRGEIEQMQGQLKLYDFQVQYATVTIQLREKDLNQTAAYLLKEQDEFSLYAGDVEGTFQKARQAADSFKAEILAANLNHNSGSNVSAELTVMVAPDQIEAFLGQVRGLGRVANFTRQTQRVAKDGGDSDNPADQTLTEKDKVQVHLTIQSDDDSRKQVALTVVTPNVDDALEQAKTAALTNANAEILSSSLNKTPQGQTSGQLSVRVPGKNYHALLDGFRALGRTSSFSLQRDDNSGPGANSDDAPVIVSLNLTDFDMPLQETALSIQTTDVDGHSQQLKKDAVAAGVQVAASSFVRQPNGMEIAQMTFRLPMSKYAAFLESVKGLGHVEALTVQRQDRPDQTRTDDNVPVEINLRLHSQGDIVPENDGFWATLRQTFGDGAGALFNSVRIIGVVIAFVVPWVLAIGVIAWVARRIYVWKRK